MDFLLWIYVILYCLILLFPFLYSFKAQAWGTYSANEISIKEKRKLLMENLKDLKADKDTKKLTEEEFLILSQDIIRELEKVDEELSKSN